MRLRRIKNPAARFLASRLAAPPHGHEVQGLRLAASALVVKIELRGLVAQVRSAFRFPADAELIVYLDSVTLPLNPIQPER